MNISRHAVFFLLALALPALAGCGYYFPHVMDGPERVIYMPDWENRTNKLSLDNRIYQSLARWFQKTDAARLTKKREGADYILAGEIQYIDLPSVSWDGVTRSKSTNVKLTVRYVLQEAKTGKLIWEVPGKLYTADYAEERVSAAGDEMALDEIIADLAEDIYIGVLRRLRHQSEGGPELSARTSFEDFEGTKAATEEMGEFEEEPAIAP